MSKPFDYSKWDNIELSDDEEDCHPNIERESWFRMKHRSRVEREEREELDKKKIRSEMADTNLRIKEIQMIINRSNTSSGDDESDDDDLEDIDGLKEELRELEGKNASRQKKLDAYEKNKKWNVDNMCKVKEERTIINPKGGEQRFSSSGYALPEDDGKTTEIDVKSTLNDETSKLSLKEEKSIGATATTPATKTTTAGEKKLPPSNSSSPKTSTTSTKKPPNKKVAGPTSESVAMLSYHEFTEQYADLIEEFMTLKSLEKSKEFLLLHGNVLLQENASNYLLLASLEDEMNGFREKMKLTARQSQIISNIAELAKSMQRHPGNVIVPFFQRIEQREIFTGFMEGVEVFIKRIIQRAVEKKKEMDNERKNTEEDGEQIDLNNLPREERLGPGGLDPMEVFDTLPESMQQAFEARDTELLKKALMSMDVKDAEYHMKRCVDCGLWNE